LFPETNQLQKKMLDAIKEVGIQYFLKPKNKFIVQDFRDSTQPLPQPFYIDCHHPPLNIPRSEAKNAQTDETLTILPGEW
jgi:hypothetical protein